MTVPLPVAPRESVASTVSAKHGTVASSDQDAGDSVSYAITGGNTGGAFAIDANTGQNGIVQAREFSSVVPLDAIFLTKLDGTAKGGIVVAIARGLDLPVRYVGTGESAADFSLFDAATFAEALFTLEPEAGEED